MAAEKASCPKCGQEVELGGMTFEENVMLVSDHRVIATSRKFKPVCPKCGPIPNVHRIGHHGTIASQQMKALFPKRYLKRLRAAAFILTSTIPRKSSLHLVGNAPND
jgi:predicted RNA-binding Zn-ribbon protein involved in translation (DUF1610 family)